MSTAAPARCPFRRSYSYLTDEYTISLGYAELTKIMDDALEVCERVESWVDDKAVQMLLDLVEHIAGLRRWTGVPE